MEDATAHAVAEIIGKELNFIQKKSIHLREALDRATDAIILNAYVQAAASTSPHPIDPNVWEYLRTQAERIAASAK